MNEYELIIASLNVKNTILNFQKHVVNFVTKILAIFITKILAIFIIEKQFS